MPNIKGLMVSIIRTRAKLIFSCNQLPPNEAEQTNAFYNRLIILSFPHRIANENIDTVFKKKLLDEIDYIFLWGLEGLRRLMGNNFQFTESEDSIKLKDMYKNDSDPIRLYLEDNCEYEISSSEGIESRVLYKMYSSWCKELGYSAKNDSVFGSSIINIYGKIKKQRRDGSKRINVYMGLKNIAG